MTDSGPPRRAKSNGTMKSWSQTLASPSKVKNIILKFLKDFFRQRPSQGLNLQSLKLKAKVKNTIWYPPDAKFHADSEKPPSSGSQMLPSGRNTQNTDSKNIKTGKI